MFSKLMMVIYAVFLIAIVYLANTGALSRYIGFYHHIPYGDAVGHFILMGTLSFLVNCALKVKRFRLGRWNFLLGSVIVAVIVTLEECSQIFIASRTFSLIDLSADYLGILFFGWLAVKWRTRSGKTTAGD